MTLPLFLALKFLREHRSQTLLTVLATSVGVAVMIFLSALIGGLQQSLIEQTLGTQPHLVVRPQEEQARPLVAGDHVVRRVERPAQRLSSIPEWQRIDRGLQSDPDVVATVPIATGSGFASRGNANRPIVIMGTNTRRFNEVIGLKRRLVAGRYRINGNEAVLGTELALDLGLVVGDRVRVSTPGGTEALLTVEGVFDMGAKEVNKRWLLTPLRTAQTLLRIPGGANLLQARVREIFEADTVARRIAGSNGMRVDSWMSKNAQLLVALRSQSSSSYTIQFFVFLAVAMGIASVLAVSVVQRTREIGILRAMGVSRRTVFQLFMTQGAFIGLLGSIGGIAMGVLLSMVFEATAVGDDGAPLFPFALDWPLLALAALAATVTGIVAAALPARRAARLDPVEAIRHA